VADVVDAELLQVHNGDDTFELALQIGGQSPQVKDVAAEDVVQRRYFRIPPPCSEYENLTAELISTCGHNLQLLVEVNPQLVRWQIGHQIRIQIDHPDVVFQRSEGPADMEFASSQEAQGKIVADWIIEILISNESIEFI